MLYMFLPILAVKTSQRTILVGKQLNAQFLVWYVYLNPLHVSSNYVLILRWTDVLMQLYSWWWAHGCSKHVEDSDKHIIEETVCQVGYLPELYKDAWSGRRGGGAQSTVKILDTLHIRYTVDFKINYFGIVWICILNS
jgi:hypothetical protein